ncbi:hypothetical protein OG788_27940 [Streptomyces sp. NBC_00647]|uniref:hypothetical protein n=1 Tax=Streptomyces sp. NBC_00647 TaxID=2975796 RepID=UPI003249ED81
MGERHGDGGTPDRRVAHPVNPGSEQAPLETRLAAALRGRVAGAEAEAHAVAAFRAARDGGEHGARTRRRDDWRPRERWRPSRSVRVTFAVMLAGLTLGGVAVAAIGSSSHADDDRDRAGDRPSNGVQDRPAAAAPSAGPGASGVPTPGGSVAPGLAGRPPQAQDTEAQCRAYASVRGRGNALNATAWQRLVTAAGGEDKVEAYCAERLAEDTGTKDAQRTGNDANDGNGGNGGTTGGTPAPGASVATPKPTKAKGGR